ncbi:hypothetical protein ACFP2F_09385 [Hymenobacter artigasi]|uniref:Uncharacterized protein n=1 Tax=Hymenobacter artigasi TaxID=2719616 RepID=A0ABX1HIS0_9BACT|nr:hypothetical protein [Hymenobacter artigasi]NKI89740.1 hypothetical protein [Hymenobacter artigasi]
MKFKNYPWVTALFISSCIYMRKPPVIIASPSGLYNLKIELNENAADRAKFHCIRLEVHNQKFELIDTLQTSASNTMKWAVDWWPGKDTIVICSRDIGNQAYYLNAKNKLVAIAAIPNLNRVGEAILEKKYDQ